MNLSRFGRKWYELEIATEPQITSGWEATFDNGTSWVNAEVVTNPVPPPVRATAVVVRWLIQGPNAASGAQPPDYILEAASVAPVIRAANDPELEAFQGPIIILE